MAGTQKVKVTFVEFHVFSNERTRNVSKLAFTLRVGGVAVGDTNKQFRVKTKTSNHPFPSDWVGEVTYTVAPGQHLDVSASVEDVHKNGKRDPLGVKTLRIWDPARTDALERAMLDLTKMKKSKPVNHVSIAIKIEYEASDGSWGKVEPEAVFACRTGSKGDSYVTVSGGDAIRVEVCPIRPCPDDDKMVERKRPVLLGSGTAFRNYAGAGWFAANAPLNVIPNPPVVPIIASGAVTANNAARIEVTYYHPASLNFTDTDARLEWTAVSTDGGALAFYDGAPGKTKGLGKKVMVYGVTEGEVTLEVRYKKDSFSTLVTKYRVLVKRIGKVKYRANIVFASKDFLGEGKTTRIPTVLPVHVPDHIAVANRFLRQAGIELVPDDNTSRSDGATATLQAGVFEVDVTTQPGLTRNVEDNSAASALNARNDVVNITYINAFEGAGTMGRASDFPDSRNGAGTITDSGTPSHAWNLPTGLYPDAAATAQTIKIYHPGQKARSPLAAMLIADFCGWYVEDTRADTVATALSDKARFLLKDQNLRGEEDFDEFNRRLVYYSRGKEKKWTRREWEDAHHEVLDPVGKTGPTGTVGTLAFGQDIAHELGHILNLRHRNEEGSDEAKFPEKLNLMSYGGPFRSQCLDIIQARVMHLSPLVRYT
jgi:hypothetical protein